MKHPAFLIMLIFFMLVSGMAYAELFPQDTNVALTGSSARIAGNRDGMWFYVNSTNSTIIGMNKSTEVTATTCELYNKSNEVLLSSGTFIGNYCPLNTNITLANGTYYSAVVTSVSAYTSRYTTTTFPINSSKIRYMNQSYSDTGLQGSWNYANSNAVALISILIGTPSPPPNITRTNITNYFKIPTYAYITNLTINLNTPLIDLLSWWKFDINATNQTTAKDSQGTNNGVLYGYTFNNGVLYGNTTINSTYGKYGNGIGFDGDGDYVGNSSTVTYDYSDEGSITHCAWINTNSITTARQFIFGGRNEIDVNRFQCMIVNANLRCSIYNGTYEYKGSVNIAKNEWTHFCYTKNSTEGKIYKNGVVSTGTTATDTTNTAYGFYIGNVNYFNGSLDSILIYNRSLSATEVMQIYNSTNTHTPVGNGLILQYSGESSNSTHILDDNNLVEGKYLQGGRFDGKDDYIALFKSPYNISQNIDISVTAWINSNSFTQSTSLLGLASGLGCANFRIQNNAIQLQYRNNTVATTKSLTSPTNLVDNQWNFVSYLINSTNVQLRINENVNTYSKDYVIWNCTNPYSIGFDDWNADTHFNGSIDDVMIFNRSLTADQISYLYSSQVDKYFPQDMEVYFGDSKDYSIAGNYNGSKNISGNITKANVIMGNKCVCTDCYINNSLCYLPVKYSYLNGLLNPYLFFNFIKTEYSYGIDNCSNSFEIPSNATALNISFYEETNIPINVSYESTLNFFIAPSNILDNFSSFSTLSNIKYCVYPNWANLTVDQQIRYTYEVVPYDYFIYHLQFDNTTEQLALSTQNDTTQVLLRVIDIDGNPIENAYIHVMKYDIGKGVYITSEILKTSSQGTALGNIVLGTDFYNFLIYYNGVLVYSEQGAKLVTAVRTFTVNLLGADWWTNFETTLGINTNLYFNEDTNNFVYTWSDPSGIMHYGCLRVDRTDDLSKATLYDNCEMSTSGTIIFTIPDVNASYYTAIGYLKYDDEIITNVITKIFEKARDLFKGNKQGGLFIAFLFIIVCWLIGIPNPQISMILLGVGFIVTSVLGLYMISALQIGSIVLLILIQLYIAGRQTQ